MNQEPPEEQTGFEFLVPYQKQLLRVPEVAKILDYDQDSILALIDRGALETHKLTAHGDEHSRKTNRVLRRSVLALLAKTADYQPEGMVATLVEIARTLAQPTLKRLIAELQKLVV